MMNPLIIQFSKLSPFLIITIVTVSVLLCSVPTVYYVTKFYGAEYDRVHVILSLVLPMLLTPPVISIFIKLSKHLKYFKDELDKEIEKNAQKDIILFEQARFVLMGEMMENISHQWKQPLNTINLTILDAKFSKVDSSEKHFNIIEDNVNYLASTINDFMSFFDKRLHTETRKLEDILQEVTNIIQVHMTNKTIDMKVEIDYKCRNIMLTSSISQVILNLLSNAKDALETSNTNKKIDLTLHVEDDFLKIKCCDNGSGIDETIIAKVFNPYFTTKEKKQGVGIGLYMSKQIVNKIFDGDMRVDISNSYGTCFYVDIPFSKHCTLQRFGFDDIRENSGEHNGR